MGGTRDDWLSTRSGHQKGWRKIVVVAVRQVTIFLQIFDKQYILPLPPQASKRISLIISMSIYKTNQKLLA